MHFYGQFDPPLDRVLYERYFIDRKAPGFFLECGAFDGVTESSCKFFEETLGWRGVNIEASPPIFERLIDHRPSALNLHCALGGTDGDVTFTHVLHPVRGVNFGNGSIHHLEEHIRDLTQSGCTFQDFSGIPMMTFRRLATLLGIRQLDLMVLDVEGAELDVISGMTGAPVLPRILCVEVGHLGHEAVTAALAPLGYRYDSESFVNAFFVRDPTS